MGRYSFWFAHGRYNGSTGNPGKTKRSPTMYGNRQTQKEEKKSSLEMRINSLLKKYENDEETKKKILGELQMYRVNLTIARDLKNTLSEKNLTKKFYEFLKQY